MRTLIPEWIIEKTGKILLKEEKHDKPNLCDFKQICHSVQPTDVLLIEGHSRVSRIIKKITQSPWSHAALYIGKLNEIEDHKLRVTIKKHCNYNNSEQLLIGNLPLLVKTMFISKDKHAITMKFKIFLMNILLV